MNRSGAISGCAVRRLSTCLLVMPTSISRKEGVHLIGTRSGFDLIVHEDAAADAVSIALCHYIFPWLMLR